MQPKFIQKNHSEWFGCGNSNVLSCKSQQCDIVFKCLVSEGLDQVYEWKNKTAAEEGNSLRISVYLKLCSLVDKIFL